MKLLRFIAFFFFISPCFAQTGTVTFYTEAFKARNSAAGLLPRSQQPFAGWLFDGCQRLAHMRAGRFVTVHMNPGDHSFTVPWHSDRPGKDALVLNVEAGRHYCIHLWSKMTNFEVIPFDWQDSQIEQVRCQEAQPIVARLKSLEIKRVDPAIRSELDPATTFPVDTPP